MEDMLLIENELVSSLATLFSLDFIRTSRQEWIRQNGERSREEQTPVDFRLFVYTRALGIIINEMNFDTDALADDIHAESDRPKATQSC